MSRPNLITTIAISLAAVATVPAQDTKKSGIPDLPKTTPNPSASALAETKPGQDDLEAKFKAALAKATFTGRWCTITDGQPGPEKEDKYTILGAAKVSGDAWTISARIQYNGHDVVAPVPVVVKWAGDTPVIIVDKMTMPGGGTFSARVLVYDKTYAGTWSGGDHGGLLSGVITNEKD